jgi:hypothetical protein
MCQCSGTPREELFSQKHSPDGTKKGVGRPMGSQGVKPKEKPSVFAASPRAASLAAIPKMRKGIPFDHENGHASFICEHDDGNEEDYYWSELRPLLQAPRGGTMAPASGSDSDGDDASLQENPGD